MKPRDYELALSCARWADDRDAAVSAWVSVIDQIARVELIASE
jgi:hypothetical protein